MADQPTDISSTGNSSTGISSTGNSSTGIATSGIVVNGAAMTMPAEGTLSDVLATLERDPRLVAIEHNGTIVPRARFASTRVSSGDQLEIVQFVQGGSLALS